MDKVGCQHHGLAGGRWGGVVVLCADGEFGERGVAGSEMVRQE